MNRFEPGRRLWLAACEDWHVRAFRDVTGNLEARVAVVSGNYLFTVRTLRIGRCDDRGILYGPDDRWEGPLSSGVMKRRLAYFNREHDRVFRWDGRRNRLNSRAQSCG
jgi:hypothetical protein